MDLLEESLNWSHISLHASLVPVPSSVPPPELLPLNVSLWICLAWPDTLKISPKSFQSWHRLAPHG